MTLTPLGDTAVVVALGSGRDEAVLRRVRACAAALASERLVGVVDVVPAFGSVTVYYEAGHIADFMRWCAELESLAIRVEADFCSTAERPVEIPVCYGGEFGPDIGDVATRAAVSADEVVALHAGTDYFVQAIGFAPGFAYLGGLPEKIFTPRRATPRTGVPAGTVGIGGGQTGVYPLATPGGWNLIGRTPLRLFDAGRAEPALLRTGDRVKFRAITAEEFAAWR